MGVSFEEALAMKNEAAAAAPAPVSFEEAMAFKQEQAAASNPRAAGRFPGALAGPQLATPEPRKEAALGDELMDVGKAGMAGVSRGAEFATDVANFPMTLGERHESAMESTAERESFLPRMLGGALENYVAGFFQPTERGKRISKMFDTDAYDATVPEDEGSVWREPLKKGVGITGELTTTGFMGGAKAAPMIAKSIPTSAALGTAGGELYGDAGEIAGIVTGALAHDPKAIAQLLTMVKDKIGSTGTAIKQAALQGKRKLRSGDTWATASNTERREALREIIKNMTGPDGGALTPEAIAELTPRLEAALARGEKGTIAQMTDNAGLRQFEIEQAETLGRPGQAALKQIDADIETSALAAVEDIAPTGIAKEAPAFPKVLAAEARREAADIPTKPGIAKLEAKIAEENARVPFTRDDLTAPATGRALHGSVDAIKVKEFDGVKKKWAKLDKVDQKIDAGRLRNTYADDLFQAVNGDANLVRAFEDDFPKTTARIAALEGNVSIAALSDVISLLSKESVGTSTSPAVIEAVKESLYGSISKGSKLRKAAAKSHRDYMEKWGPKTTTGKALKGEAEDFGVTVVTPGQKGATRLNTVLENSGQQVKDEAQDVLRARFRDEAMVDGKIDATKATAFERKYKNHLELDSMKELRDEVGSASTRANALRDTSKAVKEAKVESKRALASVEKSDVAILGGTGQSDVDVAAAIKRMLAPGKGKDVSGELTKLFKQIENNPQAKANVQRALADDFQNSVTTKGALSQDSYKMFKQRRDMYEKSGAFSKAELDRIDKQFTEGQKLFLGVDSKRLAKLPPEKRRVAEAVSALVGAKVGANLFGSPLIGAAMGRRFAVEKFRELGSDKARKLAFELTTSPEKFSKWTNALNKADASPKEIDIALAGLLDAAGVGTRTAVIEDE